MPKKQYFKNSRVARQAAENVQWITSKSLECYDDNPKTTVQYDRRNLSDLAGLLIDFTGVPQDQRDAHFEAEMKRIFQAFDTPSKDDPKKSDPELIRPYVQKMFDSIVTDLDAVNYNDVNQVTKLLMTMRSVQMLATMVADFPKDCSDFYPTKQAKEKMDAISIKAFMVYTEARVRLSERGLDDVASAMNLGDGLMKNHNMLLHAEIGNAVGKAKLEDQNTIVFNPESSDMLAHYFLGEPFVKMNLFGAAPFIMEERYTDQNCIENFPELLARTYESATYEHMVTSRLINDVDDPDALQQSELLLIEGKSMKDIMAEQLALYNKDENRAKLEAGKIFRNALLDGTSKVTLLTTTLETNGEMNITQRDIKVDLDKLNEMARVKEHNLFRRILHTFGWKIPPKYPDNKTRDKNLLEKAADPTSNHNKGVEAMRKRILGKFNGLKRPFTDKRNVVDMVPKATLVEEPLPTLPASSLSDLYPVPEGISFTSEFVANGPQESMSFEREPMSIPKEHLVGKAPSNPNPANNVIGEEPINPANIIGNEQRNVIGEEPYGFVPPVQEQPKPQPKPQPEPQPKQEIKKSPNQLKAEKLAANPMVKEILAAEIMKLTDKKSPSPNKIREIQSKLTFDTVLEAALKMWDAMSSKDPRVVESRISQYAKDLFVTAESSLFMFKLKPEDRLAVAQKITDMMINQFSPVAFDEKYAKYGDGHFLKSHDVDVIQSIENIPDFREARRVLVEALNDVKNNKVHVDLSKVPTVEEQEEAAKRAQEELERQKENELKAQVKEEEEPLDLSDAFEVKDNDEKKAPKIKAPSTLSRGRAKE